MISDTIIAALISVGGAFIIAFSIGIGGYLAREKINSMEDKIDEVDNKVESVDNKVVAMSNRREEEHGVVLGWLDTLTHALKKDGHDVERPEEVSRDVRIEENGSD